MASKQPTAETPTCLNSSLDHSSRKHSSQFNNQAREIKSMLSFQQSNCPTSATMSDSQARILDRRERIAKLSNMTQARSGEQTEEANLTRSRRQADETKEILQNLEIEGNEMFTNMSMAGTAREVRRRKIESVKRSERVDTVALELEDALSQVQRILVSKGSASGCSNPLELQALMQQHQRRCERLLHQKGTLTSKLRTALAESARHFTETRHDLASGLTFLSERVDGHVESLQNSHRIALDLLQVVSDESYFAQVATEQERWSSVWMELRSLKEGWVEEHSFLSQRVTTAQDKLYEELAEELHKSWDQLQRRVQLLEQTLVGLIGTSRFNTEKIQLNTELLRFREQEARFLRATQKCQLNRILERLRSVRVQTIRWKSSEQQLWRGKTPWLREEFQSPQNQETAFSCQLNLLTKNTAKRARVLISKLEAADLKLQSEVLGVSPSEAKSKIQSQLQQKGATSWSSDSPLSDESAVAVQTSYQDFVGEIGSMREILLKSLIKAAAGFLGPHPLDLETTFTVSGEQQVDHQLFRLALSLMALGVENDSQLEALLTALKFHVQCTVCKISLRDEEKRCVSHAHEWGLEPRIIIRVLRHFTAAQVEQKKTLAVLHQHDTSIAVRKVEAWEDATRRLDDQLEERWTRLHNILTQYLVLLGGRQQLSSQSTAMAVQNAELEYLLGISTHI